MPASIATNLATTVSWKSTTSTRSFRDVSRRRIGASSLNCSMEKTEGDRWVKLKKGNVANERRMGENRPKRRRRGNDSMVLPKIFTAFLSIGFVENVHQSTWKRLKVKMTSRYVRESIDISRKRMDVASLDMLQFHWWDYANDGYLDALKHLTDLKEEGKIKTVALTNFDTERLEKILENGILVVSNQVQHSIVDMRPQQKIAQLCERSGVKLITYGTVMGGLLSEKFLDTNLTIPFVGPSLNTPSLQKYKRMVDAWGGWNLFQGLLRTMKSIASKHGVSIPTVAVRYILDQPGVAGSMIGVRLGLAEHIQDANAIFSLVLDEEDINSIQEVTSKGKDLVHQVIGDCGDEYRGI